MLPMDVSASISWRFDTLHKQRMACACACRPESQIQRKTSVYFLFIHFSRQQECTALSTMKIISKKNLFGFFQNGTEHIFSTVGTKDFSSIALHHSLYINLSFPLIIEESRISVNVSIYSSTSNQNKSCI